jgi:hypothetical protein
MSAQLQTALHLARQHLPLFPIRPGTKKPAHAGWQGQATTEPTIIKGWIDDGHALAIYTKDHVAIDVDVKDGARGLQSLLELQVFDDLPSTLKVRTPSGGLHYIYSVDKPLRQRIGWRPGIDVKASGSYVLAAGSTLPNGTYTIEEDRPVAPCPQWLAELIGEKAPRPERRRDPVPGVNIEAAKVWAQRYLTHDAAPAIQGQGGDNRTYETACAVMNRVPDEDVAFDLMAEHYNPRCQPPWPLEELREKVENAFDHGQGAPGCAAPETGFTAVADPEDPEDFATLWQTPATDPEELVAGLIEKGIVNCLDGPGGSHKSRFALQLLLCMAAGALLIGLPTLQAAGVFLSSEDTRNAINKRSQQIRTRLNLPDQLPAKVWHRVRKSSYLFEIGEGGMLKPLPFLGRLRATLLRIPGHKLVVLDSQYDYLRYVGKAKLDEGAVNAAYKEGLSPICAECDCTIIVIRHPSQAGQDRGDMSGWSVANNNSVRSRLSLARVKKGVDEFTLTVEKRNEGPEGKTWKLYYSSGALVQQQDIADVEQRSRIEDAVVRVVGTLAAAGRPILDVKQQPADIVALVTNEGVTAAATDVRTALTNLLATGRLRYVKGSKTEKAGYYQPEQVERAGELRTQQTRERDAERKRAERASGKRPEMTPKSIRKRVRKTSGKRPETSGA